jgi:exodeoxyribonuclease V gamma subunit
MAGIRLFTSNRMEALIERLAQVLRKPLTNPLEPELIVVQSRGMERWVSMELARLNGFSGNVRFPFPNSFFDEFLCDPPPRGESAPGDRGVTALRIMRLLPELLHRPDFEELQRYLRDDPFQRKRFQLSRALADLFDQYAVFRPEMLLRWEEGRVQSDPAHLWQARLWCRLIAEDRASGRYRNGLARCGAGPDVESGGSACRQMPERIAVFGISYLPPLYLKGFEALARTSDVNLFLVNPCREYWSDVVSEREVRTLEKRHPSADGDLAGLHLEKGNRLLASLGALGRDFFNQLAEFEAVSEELYSEPQGESLLAKLQRDILDLREGVPDPSRDISADDSIQIHSCHSPMREIEILHDRILDFFEKDPGLRPGDIVVMAPDIGAYAPYIEAIFGAQTDDRLRIPYSIADRGPASPSRVQAALCALLDLKGSRLGAAEIMRLLEFPAVRDKFTIAESLLPSIEGWVRGSGIRWGLDAAGRAALGLPAEPHNTWQAGIDRLLLGYAMPSGGRELFQGMLAFDHVEGAETRVLGDFIEFSRRAFALSADLAQPKQLTEWSAALSRILSEFLAAGEDGETELRYIEGILRELAETAASAGFTEPVTVEVMRGFVEDRLKAQRIGYGFLSGGVTFCAMLPMRTIPFRAVCLVGLNHDAFPREHHPPAFDLMARNPRRGDRSRRNDDKYLFLEALLAARRTFYVSYVGQSIQDNSEQPPSVLVSELLDALLKEYGAAGRLGGDRVTRHRLQAFAPEYFDGSAGLFSYSRDDLQACARAGEGTRDATFFRRPLDLTPEEAAGWREVSPERLRSFFAHPARFLVQNRLDVRLEENAAAPEEREPFAIDPLTRYRMAQSLLNARLAGEDPRGLLPVLRAAGELPHGPAGDLLFHRLQGEVAKFSAAILRRLPPLRAETIAIDRRLSEFHLTARLTNLSAEGCLQLRYAEVGAKDFLELWLRHLFLCIGAGDRLPCRSLLIGKDALWSFEPVADCDQVLTGLLAAYWQGLSEPLPFFPGLSLAFFRQRSRTGETGPRRALAGARRKWEGREGAPGVSEDPYHRLCFGQNDPLNAEFQRLAHEVYQPLFDHCRQLPMM